MSFALIAKVNKDSAILKRREMQEKSVIVYLKERDLHSITGDFQNVLHLTPHFRLSKACLSLGDIPHSPGVTEQKSASTSSSRRRCPHRHTGNMSEVVKVLSVVRFTRGQCSHPDLQTNNRPLDRITKAAY